MSLTHFLYNLLVLSDSEIFLKNCRIDRAHFASSAFSGKEGSNKRLNLCVIDLAASHEICCPLVEVNENGRKRSLKKTVSHNIDVVNVLVPVIQ
jgi:hypothetical protein